MMIQRKGCAIFLNFFFESDLHLPQLIVQRGAHMLQPLREKALTLISNALGKGVGRSCSHLMPPTKMGKNPKPRRYDKGN